MSKKLYKARTEIADLCETARREIKETTTEIAWGSGAEAHLLGLEEALGIVDAALKEPNPEMTTKCQCAWYEAASLLCKGHRPPCVPFNGETRYLNEKDYAELVEYFLAFGPTGTTGIGALEGIAQIVHVAESNGNYNHVDFSAMEAKMKKANVRIAHWDEGSRW